MSITRTRFMLGCLITVFGVMYHSTSFAGGSAPGALCKPERFNNHGIPYTVTYSWEGHIVAGQDGTRVHCPIMRPANLSRVLVIALYKSNPITPTRCRAMALDSSTSQFGYQTITLNINTNGIDTDGFYCELQRGDRLLGYHHL